MKKLQICKKHLKLPFSSLREVSCIFLKFSLLIYHTAMDEESREDHLALCRKKAVAAFENSFLLCSAALFRLDPTLRSLETLW